MVSKFLEYQNRTQPICKQQKKDWKNKINLLTPQVFTKLTYQKKSVARWCQNFSMCFQCDIDRKRTHVYRMEILKKIHDKIFLANWQCWLYRAVVRFTHLGGGGKTNSLSISLFVNLSDSTNSEGSKASSVP